MIGRGSCFWFEVPLLRANALGRSAAETATRVETAVRETSARAMRILIAEDNAVNQLVLRKMLDRFGFESVVAENGRLAIERLEADSFDLILMDCQMPELDGYEATHRIRAHADARFRAVPIIALTADAIEGTRERCLAAGMNDYLAKPVRADDLRAALARVFADRMTGTAA